MLELIKYEEDLPIQVQLLRIKQYPWHTHKDIQIIYVIEGEVELKMTYTRYRLVQNNIHFIHSTDVHGFKEISKNNLVVVLSLSMEYFTEYFPDLDTQVFSTKVSEDVATYKKQMALKTYIFSIISEFYSRQKGYKERLKNLSQEMIKALYQEFRGFSVNVEKRTFEYKAPYDMVQIERISRVVSFVYQNYPYKMSLAAIAKQENINNYYLSHLFQRLVGDSFRNFVSMVRVEMSEFELLTTETSISQISQAVGFSNAKYYVENFRQWFGCHPREYRQLYKSEILGAAQVIIQELPLHTINDAIESYGESPVFKGAAEATRSAVFDFKKASRTVLPSPKGRTSAADLYRDYQPHQDCLALLKAYVRSPFPLPPDPVFSDTETCSGGMVALNGMAKPLYYVYQFLDMQFEQIGAWDLWYMITRKGDNAQILFFNESPDKDQDFEFHFFRMPGHYQITEHRLSAANSCIELWKQLQFAEPLARREQEQIKRMSEPRIRFQTTASSGSFTYCAQLAPMDICFTEVEKMW